MKTYLPMLIVLAGLGACRSAVGVEEAPKARAEKEIIEAEDNTVSDDAAPGDAAPGDVPPRDAASEDVPPDDAEKADPQRKALQEKFVKTLSGVTLVGYFSQQGVDKPPAEEKYTINKVTKLRGDYFLFATRIQFGGKDVTVPLLLPVKWAGDTPVITVTDVGVPGLGTYTARVLIYDDQYAGTWKGGDHGGQLWGRIVREGDAAAGEDAAPDDGREKEE